MTPSEIRRMRRFGNMKLRKAAADLSLDREFLQAEAVNTDVRQLAVRSFS